MTATCSIKEYYNGKNIFLTGGTGFLGKILIEKLLRSTNVEKIYMLARPKKGVALQERINQMFSSELFKSLRNLKPESISKIVPINGDCDLPGLGLSTEDRNILIQRVHIMYHIAATVKFDDFLKNAIITNLRSTRDMAYLALEMKKIEVFTHVSTSYCNVENKKVDEVLYPSYGSWQDAIELAERGDDHLMNVLTQKYIDPLPNTYTFTKKLAEHCVNDTLVGKIPTVICRPSIVVSAINEPFTGYIDNLNGPVALLMAGGSGILRIVYCNGDNESDYCTVDDVIKQLIISTWDKAVSRNKETPTIFHASKIYNIKVTNYSLIKLGKFLHWQQPFDNKLWFPGVAMTKYFYIYYINVMLFHVLPALVVDSLLWLTRHKPFVLKLQQRIYISNMAIHHFSLNEWTFRNDYVTNLSKKLPKEEISDFNFMANINTEAEYLDYYLKCGEWARVFFLKEKKEITKEVRTKTLRMYYLDRAVKAIFFGWLVWTLFIKINILGIVFARILNYWERL